MIHRPLKESKGEILNDTMLSCLKMLDSARLVVLFIFVLTLLTTTRSPCETLEEIVSIAKKNNPEIKRIEKELSVLKEKYKAADRLPNPSFSFNLRERGSFTVSQYIPWHEKLSLQREIEEKRYQIQQILYIQEKNKIIRQILESGFLIWFYREKIKTNKQFIEKIEKIINSGVNSSDENKLKILKTNLEVQNQESELAITKLISDIKVLANYDFKDVQVELRDIPNLNEEEVRDRIKNSNLLTKQIEKQIERDNLSYKLAKEIYMPDFGVSITYKPKDSFQDAFSLGVNLYVNVPIWRKLHQEQIVLEQKLQAIASQERKINIINQTTWSGEKFIVEYKTSLKNLDILRQMQETYTSDLESTIKNFIERRENINNLIFSISENINYNHRINQEIISANLSYLKLMEIFGEL